MPLKYVPPEQAFMICTDRESGEVRPVYHVYKDGNISDRMTYWYTFDEAEGEDNEFDIRELPNWSEHPHGTRFDFLLQDALDRGLVRINNNKLTTVGGE